MHADGFVVGYGSLSCLSPRVLRVISGGNVALSFLGLSRQDSPCQEQHIVVLVAGPRDHLVPSSNTAALAVVGRIPTRNAEHLAAA